MNFFIGKIKSRVANSLGCGNSSLSADLETVGWSNVTNIDISTVVLHNMRSQEARPQTYIAMDMTRMPFRDRSFDIVIEKAGQALTYCSLWFPVSVCYTTYKVWMMETSWWFWISTGTVTSRPAPISSLISMTSVADPCCLSWILIFVHFGSRIQKQQQKRGVHKQFFSYLFL